MRNLNRFCAVLLAFTLALSSFGLPSAFAQDAKNSLFRGYRTGYSDGYMSGYRDSVEKARRGFEKHSDFIKADRAYSKDFGSLEDYRDGYQQGFSSGYNTGYEGQVFDSSIPSTLERRGVISDSNSETKVEPQIMPASAKLTPANNKQENRTSQAAPIEPLVIIPANTELIVEILSNLSTNESRRGDSFQARVVAPVEIEGAIIEGRIENLQRPGRIKRRAELQLSFDRILLSEIRWSNMNAMVVESLPPGDPKQTNNVKNVDPEGTVQGKSSIKSDAITVGAAAGTGATVGAIAGGPVGLAVGAAVGGAFGLGGVLVARGKDIKLDNGQRLRIRTIHETQIR
jgi:type IV secretion system protein VirB10